ncbi:hypothetical protein D3H65_12575 [Paraflavitalea soli]|uniref:DUF4365 domain-containing protein n=1 Tax=Paraflavitalea soli TaxID=2315862 RepID=A0A3B7MM13_9BACT|nr:hypothetical protein [Paraflavitalea soli]AXY74767.1 hypothetical protein D3H65_12575 [Paraflavitalea soli]
MLYNQSGPSGAEDALRLLGAKLPPHWFVRIITEGDDRLDCLLEIAEDGDGLNGATAWFRVKWVQRIEFDEQGLCRLTTIPRALMTNSRVSEAPVFMFLISLGSGEIFFLPVEDYIQQHFLALLQNSRFPFYISKYYQLEGEKGFFLLHWHLQKQLRYREVENEITFFLTNYASPWSHSTIALHRNLSFLCRYFQLYDPIAHTTRAVGSIQLYEHAKRKILFCIASMLQEELAWLCITRPVLYYYCNSLIRANMPR